MPILYFDLERPVLDQLLQPTDDGARDCGAAVLVAPREPLQFTRANLCRGNALEVVGELLGDGFHNLRIESP